MGGPELAHLAAKLCSQSGQVGSKPTRSRSRQRRNNYESGQGVPGGIVEDDLHVLRDLRAEDLKMVTGVGSTAGVAEKVAKDGRHNNGRIRAGRKADGQSGLLGAPNNLIGPPVFGCDTLKDKLHQ